MISVNLDHTKTSAIVKVKVTATKGNLDDDVVE